MDNGMDYEALLEAISDPAMAEQLAQMAGYSDQMALANAKAHRADALRATPLAAGREVGRAYVASSPLEHMAVAVQRAKGEHDLSAVNKAQQGLIAGDTNARTALARAMGEAMRRRAASSPMAPVPAPGTPGYDASPGIDDPANYG
jgi:hypothetical protein